jgi:FtsP/CotA-like multicopper oxidase with cupredoxin domain
VLEVDLVATEARWYPEADNGPSEVVQVFVEEGEAPQIPGPLIRTPAGTEIRARIRNALASRLILYGFHARPGDPDDTLHVEASGTREIRFNVGDPGTYFYAGTTTVLGFNPDSARRRDSQLHGAFIVDPPGATNPPRDRVFVIGHWAVPPDPAGPPPVVPRDMFTINGKSWPHTERFQVIASDTLRWRWVNPSAVAHPMHLHGFFFQVKSRGTWAADTVYGPGEERMVVTEHMEPGGTMSMDWAPEEPGNWIFHCHFSVHVSHFVSLDKVPNPGDPLGPEAPDHTIDGMRGLIVGISVLPGASAGWRPEVYGPEARQIRLLAQSAPGRYGAHEGVGYLIHERGPEPPTDTVPRLSPALVLRRGEPVNITIVNYLRAPTGVHWHGMELPSYPDGVPGWSGTPGRLAPLIVPGDSFVAAFTPPRAGTFIYHSHSNEYYQISSGLYGALIVVDPEEGYHPERERVFIVGGNGPVEWEQGRVNGEIQPDTVEIAAGQAYRFRVISIHPDWKVYVSLREGTRPVGWRVVAKDGADLPRSQAVPRSAPLLMGPGETADFEFAPDRPGDFVLVVTTRLDKWTVRVPIRVRGNVRM